VTEGKNRSADFEAEKSILLPKDVFDRCPYFAKTIDSFDRGIDAFREEWFSPNFQQLL
jgi:hypothetical protein